MFKEKREAFSSDLNVAFIFLCATKGVHRTGRMYSLSHLTSSYVSFSRDRRSIYTNWALLKNTRYSPSVLAYWVESVSVLRTPTRRHMGVAGVGVRWAWSSQNLGLWALEGWKIFFFFLLWTGNSVCVRTHILINKAPTLTHTWRSYLFVLIPLCMLVQFHRG